MKTARKVMLLVMCAVLLVCATIAGTYAYLQSTSEVAKNAFTVGDVKITLDEFDYDKDGNTKDNVTTKTGETRDIANEYHLLPNKTYRKDPTVHIKSDSEDCYVRMQVTVGGYDQLAVAFPKTGDTAAYWASVDGKDVFLLQNLVDWNTVWQYKSCTISADGKSAVYVFWYNSVVDVSALTVETIENYKDLPALFTEITIPGSITNTELAALQSVSIDVVAHAIQADGFVDSNGDGSAADEAWAVWNAEQGN